MPIVASNGIELCYESRGEGQPLVMIMGLGAQMILWDSELIDLLVSRGFRVITFDNRDVGLSTKCEQRVDKAWSMLSRAMMGLPVSAPYTLLDMADDTVGLLDALGIEKAHVLGASMGGMIAQTMAIAHPQRVLSLTSVMSHTGDRFTGIGRPRALRQLFRPAPRNTQEAIDRHMQLFRTIGSKGLGVDETRLRDRAERTIARSFYPPGFARQFAAILASGSRSQALRYVRAPALVIHGEADPLIRPAGGRATARALPNAELMMVPGMGHDIPPAIWPRVVDAVCRVTARSAGSTARPAPQNGQSRRHSASSEN